MSTAMKRLLCNNVVSTIDDHTPIALTNLFLLSDNLEALSTQMNVIDNVINIADHIKESTPVTLALIENTTNLIAPETEISLESSEGTTIALEGIKSITIKILDKIKEVLAKIRDSFTTFFKFILKSARFAWDTVTGTVNVNISGTSAYTLDGTIPTSHGEITDGLFKSLEITRALSTDIKTSTEKMLSTLLLKVSKLDPEKMNTEEYESAFDSILAESYDMGWDLGANKKIITTYKKDSMIPGINRTSKYIRYNVSSQKNKRFIDPSTGDVTVTLVNASTMDFDDEYKDIDLKASDVADFAKEMDKFQQEFYKVAEEINKRDSKSIMSSLTTIRTETERFDGTVNSKYGILFRQSAMAIIRRYNDIDKMTLTMLSAINRAHDKLTKVF